MEDKKMHSATARRRNLLFKVSKCLYFFEDFDDTTLGHVSIRKSSVEKCQ